MFRRFFLLLAVNSLLVFNGCLLFHSVSYEITLNDASSGTVQVVIENINSDALNKSELDEDKMNLFEFALESDDFVNQMKDEGKYITDRELFVDDGILNGKILYDFNDITNVEGIFYEDPFYFLTLALDDSVISTNGEIIVSEEHKRILWDNSMKILKFKMFSEDLEGKRLTGLKQFLENE